MAYATYSDVELRLNKTFTTEEQAVCSALLDDAAILVNAYNENASADVKKLVSCRVVMRAMGIDSDIPIGATQGSMSALGYSQSWTVSNGATGELYLNKTDKKLLGAGNHIGASNPLEVLI